MQYPIAELFHSIQGEGFWTGTPMMFVRLAGCNVGKYMDAALAYEDAAKDIVKHDFELFDTRKHSICTTFDNQRFLCDTDYHATHKMTPAEIGDSLNGEYHVCITGGEPFLHYLQPLVDYLLDTTMCDMVHIETSGTKPIKFSGSTPRSQVWLTCCPKEGFLGGEFYKTMDEWKVLVGPNFDRHALAKLVVALKHEDSQKFIYLQPINGVNEADKQNEQRVLKLLEEFPLCKMSAQLHKYVGVR